MTSCEKVIDLDLSDVEPKLVIEGNITNAEGPYKVRLTESISFDRASIYPGVSNAAVVISDDKGTVDTLRYTTDGYYLTNKIKGIPGTTYNLTIVHNGKTYSASSTMPNVVKLLDIEQRTITFAGEDRITLLPRYIDLPELGNNYKFTLTQNDTLVEQLFVWNDNTNNGQLNQRPLAGNTFELKSGDKVKLELQTLDLNAYTYYFAQAAIVNAGPGGGTTPSNPANGITGGALGLFSAYAVDGKEVMVK